MNMERCVEPELLDALPAHDPRALGSRRDLERVNASMGNARIMAQVLGGALVNRKPQRIAEIGAGDGRFALSVARRLGRGFRGTSVVLVDRANAVRAETCGAFEQLGWDPECVAADVFDWVRGLVGPCDAITANLFLHHFSKAQLAGLFREVAGHTRLLVAVEPRRSAFCLRFSRLLWLLGCNRVTRHDAPVSVRAGFAGRELSDLWPPEADWTLEERAAGLFSHLFVARRKT